MLYLEDYLEIIENLPGEFKATFGKIRECDLDANNKKDQMDIKVNKFFSSLGSLSMEEKALRYEQLKQGWEETLKASEEKITQVDRFSDLIDKYYKRLEQELLKFKIELEADNPGITATLEKRSLEMENTGNEYHHKDKRKSVLVPENADENGDYNSLPNKQNHINTPNSLQRTFSKLAHDKTNGSNSIFNSNRKSGFMDTDLLSLNSNNFDFDDYLDSGFKMTDEFDRQNKKARMHKKSRNLNHINFDLSNSNSNTTSSDTGNAEFSTDPNEPRYCICNNVSYGLMICCENKQCPYNQWFHQECVGIEVVPEGSWFCSSCLESKSRKRTKIESF